MEKEHHNKVMIVIGVLLLVVVTILGLASVFGKKQSKDEQSAVVDQRTEEQRLTDSMTATKDYSIEDPQIIELNASMSAKPK